MISTESMVDSLKDPSNPSSLLSLLYSEEYQSYDNKRNSKFDIGIIYEEDEDNVSVTNISKSPMQRN